MFCVLLSTLFLVWFRLSGNRELSEDNSTHSNDKGEGKYCERKKGIGPCKVSLPLSLPKSVTLLLQIIIVVA